MIPPTIRARRAAASQQPDRDAVIDSCAEPACAGAPPPEVLEYIAAAAAAHEQLRRRGQEVRFRLGARPGTVQIELLDRVRGSVRSLTIGEAFALAGPLQTR